MFSTMATPITVRKITGSNQECEVSRRMRVIITTPTTRISETSVAVDFWALAVDTASPERETWEAPVASHAARISSTAAFCLPD